MHDNKSPYITISALYSSPDPCDGIVCGEGSECQIFEPTGEAFCNPNCEELNPCGPQQVCTLQPVNCVRAPCMPSCTAL